MSLTKVTYSMIDSAPINVKDFGAIGDGVADDTAAIQSALNTTSTEIVIPKGTYKITATITSSVSDRSIKSTGGVLFCDTADMTCLSVDGANVTVEIAIDGNDKASTGIAITATAVNYSVKNCVIKNIYSATQQAYGVVSFSLHGGAIENNYVSDVFSLGNGSTGDANGLSRGIQFFPASAPSGALTLIRNNTLNSIMGEEGDAISVQIGSTAPWPNGRCVVAGNVITNFSRRAVKVQSANTIVKNNVIKSYGQNIADLNISNAISIIASDGCVVSENQLYLDDKFPAIEVDGESVGTLSGGLVQGNYIENPTGFGVYVLRSKGVLVSSNYIKGTDCAGVELAGFSNSAEGNMLDINYLGVVLPFVSVIGENCAAINNVSVGANGWRFIRVSGVGSIIENNHNMGTTFSNAMISGPGTGSAALARGSIIRGNSSSGTELTLVNLAGGETIIADNGKRQGSGDSGITARAIWVLSNPTTERSNIFHDVGTVAWNKAAAIGSPIGWVCTVEGTPGTWVAMANL